MPHDAGRDIPTRMSVRKSGRNKPHRVKLCRWARPTRKGQGGRVALFAFSYQDLAKLFGLKVETVQKLVAKGSIDPTDLESIARFWVRKVSPEPKALSPATLAPT